MAYIRDIGLYPRPAICGKMNHIQWLVLRPLRSSAVAWSYVPPASWAATNRCRSYGSSEVIADILPVPGCLLLKGLELELSPVRRVVRRKVSRGRLAEVRCGWYSQ